MKIYEIDSALKLLNKAIELDDNYYYAYSNRATIYVIQKNYKNAIEECELVLEMNPDFAESWVFAGMLYDRIDKPQKANEYYQKSIELFDNQIENSKDKQQVNIIKLNKAVSLILLGKDYDAKQELLKLKLEDPENFMIDEIMKLSKTDYLNQILGKK